MKFNLKIFVLVGVLAGFRDVCGTEKNGENKDYGDFIVAGFEGNEELKAAMGGNRVIKAVYKAKFGGLLGIINIEFKDKLSFILVCYVDKVEKVEAGAFNVRGNRICYDLGKGVEYTVYFIFKNELLNSTASMFKWSQSLIRADFRCFNTINVTDMSTMFQGCSSLEELDLSNFNTSKVTNMADMFDLCTSLNLVSLPLKDVDIKKRCICCGDEYVRWNNHEVVGLNPKIVKGQEA